MELNVDFDIMIVINHPNSLSETDFDFEWLRAHAYVLYENVSEMTFNPLQSSLSQVWNIWFISPLSCFMELNVDFDIMIVINHPNSLSEIDFDFVWLRAHAYILYENVSEVTFNPLGAITLYRRRVNQSWRVL